MLGLLGSQDSRRRRTTSPALASFNAILPCALSLKSIAFSTGHPAPSISTGLKLKAHPNLHLLVFTQLSARSLEQDCPGKSEQQEMSHPYSMFNFKACYKLSTLSLEKKILNVRLSRSRVQVAPGKPVFQQEEAAVPQCRPKPETKWTEVLGNWLSRCC